MIEVWTLTVDDHEGLHTSVHTSEADALAVLRSNYDADREYPDDDFVQCMIDNQGLVIYVESHKVMHQYPELDGFGIVLATDYGPSDLVLRHHACGVNVCDVEEGDEIDTYARLAAEHLRFNANVGSECPAHPLNPLVRKRS